MSTRDYDAPRPHRGAPAEPETDSLEGLQFQRTNTNQTATIDVDYTEGFTLPDAEDAGDNIVLSEEELTVPVVPMQATEFRCSACFLVHPMRRRAYNRNGEPVCNDCA